MRLSETIYINPSDQLSKLCHLAKNLYNLANWYVRQDFLKLNNFLNYYDLDYILKDKQAYRKLPSQTSQQILKLVNRNWRSYFGALKEYRANPKKFKFLFIAKVLGCHYILKNKDILSTFFMYILEKNVKLF